MIMMRITTMMIHHHHHHPHPVPSPHRRLAATDLQHTLSLAFVVHSDILYPVHLLMFLSHVYLCLPLSRRTSTFPSSKVFNKESCLFICPTYFICLSFNSFNSTL